MHYTIKDALAQTPLAPCERFGGCPSRNKCATEELACEQFYVYVLKTGTRGRMPSREPEKRYYERIFKGDDE